MLICRALIKYGYSNFSLEILEYCKPEDRHIKETHYINIFNSEYNILKVANTMPQRTGISRSEETRMKTSFSNPNRIVVSVTDTLTNTKTIYDSLSRAGDALGTSHSQINYYLGKKDEGKLFRKRNIIDQLDYPKVEAPDFDKVIESWHSGIRVKVLDLETNTTTVYSTIRSAARATELVHSTIRKYLTLGVPYKNKYLFTYSSSSDED